MDAAHECEAIPIAAARANARTSRREERERSKAASERGASERARGRRERDDARAGRDEREAGERKEEGRENHLKMVRRGRSEAGWRAERYRCDPEAASRLHSLCCVVRAARCGIRFKLVGLL